MTTALLIWFAVQLVAGGIFAATYANRVLKFFDYEIKLDAVAQALSEGGQ